MPAYTINSLARKLLVFVSKYFIELGVVLILSGVWIKKGAYILLFLFICSWFVFGTLLKLEAETESLNYYYTR